MAGIRPEPRDNGKYVGWYVDYTGRQRTIVGTRKPAQTLRMMRKLEDEHREIRVGTRPVPQSAEKHRSRLFAEVAAEYCQWGRSQGGRGGRPWGSDHALKRVSHLAWWGERLSLSVLGDLDGVLPRAEAALREMQAGGAAGKTLMNRVESLHALCCWCVSRGFMASDPLAGLAPFDTTPRTERRALRQEELHRLLEASSEDHRIVYETAAASGLRAGELKALQVRHLDVERSGLRLSAAWTKGRREGFQHIARWLARKLAVRAAGRGADEALLPVPGNPADALDNDLLRAGISKHAPGGRVDFHALRVFYCTALDEVGASAKEAEVLARHAPVSLTARVYQKVRDIRLEALAEAVGAIVLNEKYVAGMHRKAAGAESLTITQDAWCARGDSNPHG